MEKRMEERGYGEQKIRGKKWGENEKGARKG